MPSVLVRKVPSETLEILKARARESGRSLEAELRRILLEAAERPAPMDRAAFRDLADRIRESLKDYPQSDSVEMIREDRDR